MFIDNNVMTDLDAEDEEKDAFNFAIEKLFKFTANTTPFYCKDFKEVMKHNEKLKLELLKLQSQFDQDKSTYEKKLEE